MFLLVAADTVGATLDTLRAQPASHADGPRQIV